ncbi:MAG: FAD-dependent monooxygenase [Polyangiales bacterium]
MTSRWTADVDVLIVGAGPTGLVAAIDARRHGLSVRIVDQGAQRNPHSKALVLHSRSLEVLDDLGCVEPVLQAGREFRALNIVADGRPLGRVEFRRLDWSDAPYPMWLSIPQSETERCLEDRLNALGVNVERQTALRALRETERGVEADLVRPDGAIEASRSAWLVGCDGARSDVRRALGWRSKATPAVRSSCSPTSRWSRRSPMARATTCWRAKGCCSSSRCRFRGACG